MIQFLLAVLLIALIGVDSADARRKRHYRPYAITIGPEMRGNLAREPTRETVMGPRSLRALTLAALIPRDWQLQPADPNWNGKRFLSPDGQSSFAAYRTLAVEGPISEHMKTVLFAEGETITYIEGQRTWVAVSGFKGSYVFYRKAIVACAGKAWHHVAFEYPAELKRDMDGLVALAARALDNTQHDCGEATRAD